MPIDSVKWAEGRKAAFIAYIDTEIQDALGPHDNLVATWIRQLAQYRAPATKTFKSVPYEGAADYTLPMTATDGDQLYAKFLQTIHAAENVWTCQPLNERWTDASKPIQDFLTWLDVSVLKMYPVNKRVLMEMVKHGTGIYKTGWDYERRKIMTYEGGKAVPAWKTTGKPFVDHVRLADFLLPPGSYDIDPDAQGGAPWVAEKLRIKTARLKWMAESSAPYLPNLDKEALRLVILFEEQGQTAYDEAVQALDQSRGSEGKAGRDFDTDRPPAHVSTPTGSSLRAIREIELWEVHARFPSQSADSQDDIIGWYHKPTRRLVRSVYNYYHHGKRPYDVVRYFPGDGFYGIGICEQKEVFQQMASDLFNFNWDNVLLANSRMVVTNSGTNIAPGEPFYPNKVWVVDGPVNQSFGVFPMADVYPSLDRLQGMVQAMGEKRTSIGDMQLGNMQTLPSRTPATTAMSLLQEGNRRPDLTLKDMRYEGMSPVGLKVLQLCQQYFSSEEEVGGKALLQAAVQMLGQPEGQIVARMLGNPIENVEFGLGVSIAATSSSANKDLEKQHYLEVLQVAGQISQQILQFTQIQVQFANTPLADAAGQAIHAILEIGKRLLEQMDIKNIDAIIPDTAQPQGGAGVQGQQQQLGAGGAGVPAGPLFGPTGAAPLPPVQPSF